MKTRISIAHQKLPPAHGMTASGDIQYTLKPQKSQHSNHLKITLAIFNMFIVRCRFWFWCCFNTNLGAVFIGNIRIVTVKAKATKAMTTFQAVQQNVHSPIYDILVTGTNVTTNGTNCLGGSKLK